MKRKKCTVWDHIQIVPGTISDFDALEGFHYREGRVVGVTRVFVAWYTGNGMRKRGIERPRERAGVLVECHPVLNCRMRNVALRGRYWGLERRAAAERLNREMRVISRVVVEPRFRGMGLAVALVRHALDRAQTRYVEAMAVMGRVNPFFEHAGMRRFSGAGPEYFLWERGINCPQ